MILFGNDSRGSFKIRHESGTDEKKTFWKGRYELISARNFIILQHASIVYSLNSRVPSLYFLSRLEKEGALDIIDLEIQVNGGSLPNKQFNLMLTNPWLPYAE